jgi:hypothetical protein
VAQDIASAVAAHAEMPLNRISQTLCRGLASARARALGALLGGLLTLLCTAATQAEWAPDPRGARSAAGPQGLRVLVRYDDDCKPELIVGQLARQRTVRVPWGQVRAAVDGELVAIGEQSPGQRVRLTEHAVSALEQGSEVSVSVGDHELEVYLSGSREAIGAVGVHCRGDEALPGRRANHWTVVSGDIGAGWADAVMDIVRAVGATGLVIEANGGDLAEAEKLGRWIRDRGLDTAVTGDCALACLHAFAGGVLRFIAPQARLGLQRLPRMGGDGGIPGAVVRQTGYLIGLGIRQAQAVAERAAAAPPDTVDWLDAEQALALDLATELGTPGNIAAAAAPR